MKKRAKKTAKKSPAGLSRLIKASHKAEADAIRARNDVIVRELRGSLKTLTSQMAAEYRAVMKATR